MTTAHYCLWFAVAEVNEKTATWPLVAVMSPLPDVVVVVVVVSGHLHFTAAVFRASQKRLISAFMQSHLPQQFSNISSLRSVFENAQFWSVQFQ